ncbi:IS4 family transposase, partial [Shewanella sp. SM34]|nr:IS4 family transposase [Shewanella sp. SM35]MCU8067160.1 IS4 family transposase [Shewanella sp. SM34]MCU8072893.1 IS4 family transposase [Shewanella sp. SM29]MCU8058272.1 IS4 family transposase [Shewanella sp. SM35]MCU8058841.1 IS4 family transposase [Shewanella sp. SM35]
ISMLAEIVLWCIGLAAQHLGWQRYFQANTVRKQAVLSIVRLGKEVRKRDKYPVKETIFRWALIEYINLVHDAGKPQL